MRIKTMSFLFLSLSASWLHAEPLQFSLHKLESNNKGPTLLVIGGIQGDEPGGFTAASMLVTNYKVTQGNVWVVPNLNFASIIERSRGIHGDMNRKFKTIAINDPEFHEVKKIKEIILHNDIDLILNLHDGSGFYKKKYINAMHNPDRWGQSIIIDQSEIAAPKFGDLAEIAAKVQKYINSSLKNKDKYFYVKNTETKKGDIEMEKTLTYFSITNNRPAFGIEASKIFLTHERAYYHLLAVEGFMNEMGIKFQRDFDLTHNGVAGEIGKDLKISLYDNRINLDVDKARRYINYFPLKKHSALQYSKNNPLLAVVDSKNSFKVRYGNRHVTSLRAQYFDYDYTLDSFNVQVDGKMMMVKTGEKINIEEDFKVLAADNYRVNIIGFSRQGITNENNILINKKQIKPRFSVDRDEKVYRVEFYNGERFSGMILVNFIERKSPPLTMKNISHANSSL